MKANRQNGKWTIETITVATACGREEVNAVRLVGSPFAYHKHLPWGRDSSRGAWTLTYVPTGHKVNYLNATNERTIRKLAIIAANSFDGSLERGGPLHNAIMEAMRGPNAIGRFT